MAHNRIDIILHYVWTTIEREPLITPEMERPLYRCIHGQCKNLRCEVIAVGGMPDHVHLAVSVPTTIELWKIMHAVKGVSSSFVRDQLLPAGDVFGWRDNYSVFSVSRSHKTALIEYIRNQKQHHADGTLWPNAEPLDEE